MNKEGPASNLNPLMVTSLNLPPGYSLASNTSTSMPNLANRIDVANPATPLPITMAFITMMV